MKISKKGQMKISKEGLDLIKQFEGKSNKAYKCPADVWTIGIGFTRVKEKYVGGSTDKEVPVTATMLMTDDSIDACFVDVLEPFEKTVNKVVKVPLLQSQYDTLVSLCFNIGVGNFSTSTLVKKLNANDYKGAAEEFLKWNKAGGKPKLTRRREIERKLFLSGGNNVAKT